MTKSQSQEWHPSEQDHVDCYRKRLKTEQLFYTAKFFDYLPLPTDGLSQKYWLTANNDKEEMEWQEQAFSEEELIELINDAIKGGLTVKVESI